MSEHISVAIIDNIAREVWKKIQRASKDDDRREKAIEAIIDAIIEAGVEDKAIRFAARESIRKAICAQRASARTGGGIMYRVANPDRGGIVTLAQAESERLMYIHYLTINKDLRDCNRKDLGIVAEEHCRNIKANSHEYRFIRAVQSELNGNEIVRVRFNEARLMKLHKDATFDDRPFVFAGKGVG